MEKVKAFFQKLYKRRVLNNNYGEFLDWGFLPKPNDLYPSGIPRREPPSCKAPREPTIYVTEWM